MALIDEPGLLSRGGGRQSVMEQRIQRAASHLPLAVDTRGKTVMTNEFAREMNPMNPGILGQLGDFGRASSPIEFGLGPTQPGRRVLGRRVPVCRRQAIPQDIIESFVGHFTEHIRCKHRRVGPYMSPLPAALTDRSFRSLLAAEDERKEQSSIPAISVRMNDLAWLERGLAGPGRMVAAIHFFGQRSGEDYGEAGPAVFVPALRMAGGVMDQIDIEFRQGRKLSTADRRRRATRHSRIIHLIQ
jgi:hypothetical protein